MLHSVQPQVLLWYQKDGIQIEYNLYISWEKLPSFGIFIYTRVWNLFSGLRLEIFHALEGLGCSSSRGLFINSCYVHCQTVTEETWLSNDSFVLSGKMRDLFSWPFIFVLPCTVAFFIFGTSRNRNFEDTCFLVCFNFWNTCRFLISFHFCAKKAFVKVLRTFS